MSNSQTYYVLKITRPEHPAVFVQEIRRGEELVMYDETLMPTEAHRYETLDAAIETATRLAAACREFQTHDQQLCWSFVRKIVAYEPWSRPPTPLEIAAGQKGPFAAGFEPKGWERAIISHCEVVVMRVSPGLRPERVGLPLMIRYTVPAPKQAANSTAAQQQE